MVNSWFEIQQDTVKRNNVVIYDTVNSNNNTLNDSIVISSDTQNVAPSLKLKDSVTHIVRTSKESLPTSRIDITAVCRRNSITDITFYNPSNIISSPGTDTYLRFPFSFVKTNRVRMLEEKAVLINRLKPGKDLPDQSMHTDWIILIFLFTAFLYSIIRSSSKNILLKVTRYFMLRGINENNTRDSGGLFQWQSTILNLISFLIISLFVYSYAFSYNMIPSGFDRIKVWLISLLIIITAITLRHIACIITGNLSGETELFKEYLLSIYQSFRFSAFFLFVILILIYYTTFLPTKDYLVAGIVVFGIMYLVRYVRLFIIFINRNISIFYLILYLCALEMLPVLVTVKYFTGLV